MKPTLIKAYMNMAQSMAELSYCRNHKVGCVLVKGDRIISTGYNGTIKGQPNVCENPDGFTSKFVLHAEENAILKAARDGQSTLDSVMFTTLSCCPQCSKMIAQAGVTTVYYKEKYKDMSGIDWLVKFGVRVEQCTL